MEPSIKESLIKSRDTLTKDIANIVASAIKNGELGKSYTQSQLKNRKSALVATNVALKSMD